MLSNPAKKNLTGYYTAQGKLLQAPKEVRLDKLKKKAYWRAFIKTAKSAGLSSLHVLGLCTLADGGRMDSPDDPIIYEELYKAANEDGEAKRYTRLKDDQKNEDNELDDLLKDQKIQNSVPGSPVQEVSKSEESELSDLKSDQEMQYEGKGPVDCQDPKEAGYRDGYSQMLMHLTKQAGPGLDRILRGLSNGASVLGNTGRAVGNYISRIPHAARSLARYRWDTPAHDPKLSGELRDEPYPPPLLSEPGFSQAGRSAMHGEQLRSDALNSIYPFYGFNPHPSVPSYAGPNQPSPL